MKIAVTYEAGTVFPHFGHTAAYKLYEVEDGKVLSSEIVQTTGSGHGALAGLLEGLGVNVLICGGIGAGARFALEDADIQIFAGVSGDADEAVEHYLSGELNSNAACGHHHHHDHGCGCGHHHDHEEHHHDHGCGCGHHHDHEEHHHDHGCGCGHHHGHEEHHHHDHGCGCGHHHE